MENCLYDPPTSHRERDALVKSAEIGSSELLAATAGGSASGSPVSGTQPLFRNREKTEMPEELDDLASEEDELEEGERETGLTAAELRAQKRKMKRFRLTHSQTRFLMSEFVRQAHPDAAHRERLAREIPGLSPRQVQVWFQNRRAKLKRLTIDDRERIMRSRELPKDFDTTQALHSPFSTASGGTFVPSPEQYAPMFSWRSPTGCPSPSAAGRLLEHAHLSPTSISPALGGLTFRPELGGDATYLHMDQRVPVGWVGSPQSVSHSGLSYGSIGESSSAYAAPTSEYSSRNERPVAHRPLSNPSSPYGLGHS
ncbi:hypothetical protein H2201_001903, partial [Coniosporium apollinis]